MVIDKNILKNNQITLFSSFTIIPKAGVGLSETGVNIYRELTPQRLFAKLKAEFFQYIYLKY